MGENFDGSFFGYENVWEKIKGCGIFNSVPFKGYEKSYGIKTSAKLIIFSIKSNGDWV